MSKKVIFALACLLSMALGTITGAVQYNADKTTKTTGATTVPEGTNTSEATQVEKREFPQEAYRLVEEGKQFYREGRFLDAEDNFTQAEKLIFQSGFPEHELYTEAVQMKSRCIVFGEIASRQPRNPLADGNDIVRLKLKNKTSLRLGRLEPIDEKTVKFISLEGSEVVRKANIESKVEVTEDEFREELKKQFRERVKDADGAIAKYSRGVLFALNWGLTGEAIQEMEEVFEGKGWDLIIDFFLVCDNPEDMKTLVDIGFGRTPVQKVYRQVKDPDTGKMIRIPSASPGTASTDKDDDWASGIEEDGKPDRGDPPGEPRKTSTPSPAPADDDLAIAEQAWRAAKKIDIMPDCPDYVKNMEKALVLLRKAQKHYEIVFKRTHSQELEDQLQKIQQLIYYIVRNKPMSD